MNNRHDKYTRLLAETFHESWETGAPADFARAAAKLARRRRAARRAARAAGAIAVVGVAALIVLQKDKLSPPSAPVAKAVVPKPGYEILSDAELLAQVRNQPLLAVKREDGTQQIIVLAGGSE